jgi:hypothetical protein
MTGIQLIGKDAVLSRFSKCDGEAWALYQGKGFIVGGIGADTLDDWLTDFDKSGTTAAYTLRVYDTTEAPTSSTGNNDYIACMQFKLVDDYGGYGIAGHSNKLMERIKGLEEKLEGGKDDNEGEDFNSIIMGWLQDPQKLGMVAGAIRTLFGGSAALPMAAVSAAPVQTISGLDPTGNQAVGKDDEITRLSRALDVLGSKDPQLVVHLEKLARLAQTDDLLFKAVISKLDAL